MNRRPLRLSTVTVTTRHGCSVYPWQTQQTLPDEGVLIGVNQLSGGNSFSYDPWQLYAQGVLTSPNMIVLGQLGVGKSALVKTYLHRQLLAGRPAYILDPKGEYAPLAALDGLSHIALKPGGTQRLNPLDPPPGRTDPATLATARASITAALAGAGLGRPLRTEERAAIGAATTDLPDQPVLAHVVARMLQPTEQMAAHLHTTPNQLAAAIRPAALELQRLLSGDLAGMVDGPSTTRPDPHSPGVVVDLSAVHGTPALAPVMTCASAWLTATLASDTPIDTARRRLLLVDEAWALLGAPATAAWLQAVSKLARRHGVQLITVVHRLSDLTGQADAGTATAAQASGLLSDAETRVIYRQASAERQLASDLLDLTSTETELVCQLPAHRALWLIGQHAAVADHLLSDLEQDLVDTDARMRP